MTDPEEVQELKEWTAKLVEAVDKVYSIRFDALERMHENFERQLAMLTAAYAECTVVIQAIMDTKFEDLDLVEFKKRMAEPRRQMLEALRGGADKAQTDHPRFHPGAHTARDDTPSEDAAGSPDQDGVPPSTE